METPSSMTSPRWALLASVAGALGASLCCAVPLLLVSLGIGGSWLASLTALEPYRPLFFVLSICPLATPRWRPLRPTRRRRDCRDLRRPKDVVPPPPRLLAYFR